MENDKVEFTRKVFSNGDSLAVVIPADIVKFLGIVPGQELAIIGSSGTKGRYAAFWKKEGDNSGEEKKE